jgi:glycosyltransferase involved in cell wall biosynthesis
MSLEPYCRQHVVAWDRADLKTRGPIGRSLQWIRKAVADIEAMHRHARECARAINEGGFDVLFANSCQYHAVPAIARYVKLPSVLYLQEPSRGFYEAQRFWDQDRLFWVPPCPFSSTTSRRWVPSGLRRLKRLPRTLIGSFNELAFFQSVRLLAREENTNVRSFTTVLCNSLFSREAMQRVYGLESKVCLLGIDTGRFTPSEEKQPYVVGLGTFHHSKGIERALYGISRIPSESRPTLVWIGNMNRFGYMEEMSELAGELGVRFEPRLLISQEELVWTLGRAAVMVYTSRLEPFGYAPLEANACGTAVVGVAEGGIRETIVPGVNGVLVDLSDVDALGRAIRRYVDDLDLAREHGLRARQHVIERWGIEGAIDRIEEALVRAAREADARFEPWRRRHPDTSVESCCIV